MDVSTVTTEYDSGRARRLLLGAERPTWQVHAACRGMGVRQFFAEEHGTNGTRRGPGQYTKAREVCAECPVVVECADYGSHFGEKEGLWGGMAPAELRKWRRMRGSKAVCQHCEAIFRLPIGARNTAYCSFGCRDEGRRLLKNASNERKRRPA